MSNVFELDNLVKEMLKYTKHLPGDKRISEELLVLKGHLLIEQQLNALIECKVIKPKALKAARLTYTKKLHLLEALYGELPSINWNHLRDINFIRNCMAHELENESVVLKLKEFVQSVGGKDVDLVEGGFHEQLAYCISYLHLELVKARDNSA